MTTKKFSKALGNIGENYIGEAVTYTAKNNKKPWIKWTSLAACFLLIMISIPFISNFLIPKNDANGTLPGDTEIYPMIMVQNQTYEWRRGKAICDKLPNDSVYYGDLIHVTGEKPQNNCEFVSVFSVTGQIYISSENKNCIYLCITTEWLTETIVIFDLVRK